MATKTKTASTPPAGDDKGEPVFGKQETILVTGEGSPRGGDETSKTFRTIAGKAYCLALTTGGVSVYGSDTPELTPEAVSLLAAKTAGQYIFIAISSYTTVSVDSSTQYVLTPLSFNGAFLGASSGGGGSFDPTSNQTITGMWSFSNIVVPTPDRGAQAANKGYVDSKIDYVKARGFSNSSSTPSFIVSDLPKPSNMKIKLNPRRNTYNEGAKIQIPQNIVQYLQIVVDQGDGTVKYEDPTLVGTNLEITPKKGMSIEMTCLCSAGTATVCTCVGFNDYDVMGDAYFLSAIV